MFVLYDKEAMNVPVKVWLPDETALEASCREQAMNLSKLPFLNGWVCLMPDTHAGMGMPIGGVIAAEDVLIPNAPQCRGRGYRLRHGLYGNGRPGRGT